MLWRQEGEQQVSYGYFGVNSFKVNASIIHIDFPSFPFSTKHFMAWKTHLGFKQR